MSSLIGENEKLFPVFVRTLGDTGEPIPLKGEMTVPGEYLKERGGEGRSTVF